MLVNVVLVSLNKLAKNSLEKHIQQTAFQYTLNPSEESTVNESLLHNLLKNLSFPRFSSKEKL